MVVVRYISVAGCGRDGGRIHLVLVIKKDIPLQTNVNLTLHFTQLARLRTLFRTKYRTAPTIQIPIKIAACTGAKTAPRTTTNPLIRANKIGIAMKGLTGRCSPGSRKRRMIAPSTVRKKNAYSASPFRVSRMRMLPSRM